MWLRLAKWFEWVFATILMTTITVIVSLQYLSGFAQWALLISLFIFFVHRNSRDTILIRLTTNQVLCS